MAVTKEELNNPGDVMLEKCELEGITGDLFNILDVVSEINIYEDLFSNGVTGDVFIVDSNNLVNLVPLIGQELIRIKFKTPVIDPNPIRELTFQIYKISARTLKNDRTQGYILHFCSPSVIKNALTKVHRTLGVGNETNIASMIPKLVQDDLKADLGSVSGTLGSYEFIIPYWSPFKTINWLAQRAITDNANDQNFVFYETINDTSDSSLNGMIHNFRAIGQLFHEDANSDMQYKFGPINRKLEDTGKELYPDIKSMYFTINDYEIPEAMDNLTAIRNGMYASRLISYDVITKKISDTTFDYLKYFDSDDSRNMKGKDGVEEYPVTVQRQNPAGLVYTDHPDSNIRRHDTHDQQHTNFPNSPAPDEWLLQRQSSLQQLMMNRFKCVVPGNSVLRVGNMLPIYLPSPELQDKQGYEDFLVSGNYIIVSLRHKIQKNSYWTHLEMAKDSFHTEIPSATKNNR